MKKILLFLFCLNAVSVFSQIRQVKDIRPGASSSLISDLTVYDGKLFFAASNEIDGIELFMSDGTDVGTTIVRNINTSTSPNHTFRSSTPQYLTISNNLLFFNANNGNGRELWVTDGNSANTIKLTTSNIGGAYTGPRFLYGSSNGLYFRANSRDLNPFYTYGNEPWISDGTVAGTQMLTDISPFDNVGSEPRYFFEFSNKIYFSAIGSTGNEIYKADFIVNNATIHIDLTGNNLSSSPSDFIEFNNKLFFTAEHPTLGREIFSTNAVGSLTLLKDINTIGNSTPTHLTKHNGLLFFSASNGANNQGKELWVSDGFSFGTNMVKDINPATVGDRNSNPYNFTSLGTDLFFVAKDNINGFELWKTDGTSAGTMMVKDIAPAGSSNPENLTAYNGKLYFTAQSTSSLRELWVSDGTNAGTLMISNLEMGNEMKVLGNELYFDANDGIDGEELWAYRDPTLSVEDVTEENKILLLPNLVVDAFEIKTNLQIHKVEIINVNGQVVKTFNEMLDKYSIKYLSNGLYFVKISGNNGEQTLKIIKN